MIQMLAGTTISGQMRRMYLVQNCVLDRRQVFGGICSMALHKKGLVPSQGTLLLSKLYVSLYRRAKNTRYHKLKCCCSRFLSWKACLQNESKGFVQPGKPRLSYQKTDLTVLADSATVGAQNTEWNTILLRDKELTSAIFYEAERGYRDTQGRTMRFSDFLSSRILPLCSSFLDMSAQILSEEVKNYAQSTIECRFNLLNKIALLMGYKSMNAMIAHERALRESTQGLQSISDNKDRTVSLVSLPNSFVSCQEHEERRMASSVGDSIFSQASQTFPCILLGSSQHVNLYSMSEENSGEDYQYIENDVEGSIMQRGDTNFGALSNPQTHNVGEEESNQANADFEIDPEPENCILHLDEEYLPLSNEVTLEMSGKAGLKEGCVMADTQVSLRETTSTTERRVIHVDCFLDVPIGTVRSLTPTQRCRLDENGFHTVRKLLQHFPRAYVNFQDAKGQLENGKLLNLTGRVLSSRGRKLGNAMGMIEVIVECQIPGADENYSGSNQCSDIRANKRTVYLHLKRYFRGVRFTNPWVLKKIQSDIQAGDLVSVSGKVMALEEDNHFEMRDYNLDVLKEETGFGGLELSQKEKLYPIYPSKGNLDRKYIGDCIKRLLDSLPVDLDPVPDSVRDKFNLMKLHEAYSGIHCPKDRIEAESARRRFIFDDFFYPQLGLLFQRHEVVKIYTKSDDLAENSIGLEDGSYGVDKWSQLTVKVLRSLPFSLTHAQLKAASEIIWDLQKPVPMNRLLQGDVGCGKTVVSLLAAFEVIDAGCQAAFMVPTELLAMQHYETIVSMLGRINKDERPSVALLTGSTPLKEVYLIRMGLETGDIALVVGTHSLISESVKFASLRLAIIDEQHRFGVAQRGKFSSKVGTTMDQTVANDMDSKDGILCTNKAFVSHVLVMSATPIPRTLALALYGDMSFTQINETLPGRTPVKTFAFYGNDPGCKKAYQMVQEELDNGGRAFFVYAAIDESKQLPQLRAATAELEMISNIFKDFKCGLLHGRMKATEKEAAMQQFKAGETQILLSTQVIEVGIDVPDATMMVIINAERFGMSQLHQLRGRIGRGSRQATCILLTSSASGLKRLKLLEKSSDGFYLAEADLHFRGPGNLFGIEQSGHLPEFSIARLETDGDVLEQAHVAASDILQKHQFLEGLPKLKAELSMRHSFNTFVP